MTHEIRPAVTAAIRKIVKKRLKGLPVEECRIAGAADPDGDEAIFVDVHYVRPSDTPIDPRSNTELQSEVWEAVFRLGERRFPYIEHYFADGQKIKGW